jgi:integrase/recombinase XerD
LAAYIEQLAKEMSPPSVKQYLACVRMLFDWLVTGQVMPPNPAHSVRRPRHSVSKGVTPVLSSEEETALLTGMDVSIVAGLRERAIIAAMTFTSPASVPWSRSPSRITTRRKNAGGSASARKTAR